LATDKRILHKPEPLVGVQQLNESGLHMQVHCWVNTADYGTVFHQGQQVLIETLYAHALPFAKS
jgi:small-conductance mechanosensitive channel